MLLDLVSAKHIVFIIIQGDFLISGGNAPTKDKVAKKA